MVSREEGRKGGARSLRSPWAIWRGVSAFRSAVVGALFLLPALLPGCGGTPGGGPLLPRDSVPSLVPCYFADGRCLERVPVGNSFVLPIFRTHPIASGDTTVTRVVITVHGAGRDADQYFDTMLDVMVGAGQGPGTMVLAPHFQTLEDAPGPDDATWSESGWKRGNLSNPRTGTGVRLSSYEALDVVLGLLGDPVRFPRLESVLLVGHSAGGQYTHRFAATSPAEGELPRLRFRYVVANPSTYLYLGPERPLAGGGFGLPDRAACPDYNEWHYGFEERNTYAQRLTEEQIRDRLVGREVVYLVGTEDLGTDALDMSCGAMLQGERRYPRGLNLFAYLEALHPGHRHRLFEVPGVAHSSRGMYSSEIGRTVLFQW